MSRLRILTWHVHGTYLYYLSRIPHDIFVPQGRGHAGRGTSFHFPANVMEVPADEVRNLAFDLVLYQSRTNYLQDRAELLSDAQRTLPSIYLEHDPPRGSPTDTLHVVDDPNVLLVHVTPFNALMWDSGEVPTTVIEHGIAVPPGVTYSGELPAGVVAINNLRERGRRLGADLFLRARARMPLDLVGMGAEALGGLGEVPPMELAAFEARYRFFFSPIRWTSCGLAVLEAMHIGMPVVALATTEMATVIENGETGFTATDPAALEEAGLALIADRELARKVGAAGRTMARDRFSMSRFVDAWQRALESAVGPKARAGVRAFHPGARV